MISMIVKQSRINLTLGRLLRFVFNKDISVNKTASVENPNTGASFIDDIIFE